MTGTWHADQKTEALTRARRTLRREFYPVSHNLSMLSIITIVATESSSRDAGMNNRPEDKASPPTSKNTTKGLIGSRAHLRKKRAPNSPQTRKPKDDSQPDAHKFSRKKNSKGLIKTTGPRTNERNQQDGGLSTRRSMSGMSAQVRRATDSAFSIWCQAAIMDVVLAYGWDQNRIRDKTLSTSTTDFARRIQYVANINEKNQDRIQKGATTLAT
ncbi:hypothetical protein H4582DRAFT_1389182 [Lactarius indigo]|nr:hypothetical protein H4582DRAFT_1389182 [Lactarius indigo]